MKKIITKLSVFVLAAIVIVSCKEPDNAIYSVFDNISNGAVLRTLNKPNETNFNIFDLSSEFKVVFEVQDSEEGKLLEKVDVYATFTDKTSGGTDNSKPEVMVATIPAADFTTSADGLPSASYTTTLANITSKLGLATGEFNGGDAFSFRLAVTLTDGRTFSVDQGTGSTDGGYYSSPYQYNTTILCIPSSPIAGDYLIKMKDSYGDGWQGSKITATIDGVATNYSLPDRWSCGCSGPFSYGEATITVPAGATSFELTYSTGQYESEVSFEIITPSGAVGIEAGPAPAAGGIALDLCNE